jgi:serine palmitoyltransferase
MGRHTEPTPTWWAEVTTYFGYALLFVFGHMRDFFGKIFKSHKYQPPKGYAPLLLDFEDFYTRRLYYRIRDCWNRPINSAPGAHISVMERTSSDYNKTIKLTGNNIDCMNLGSYNYLGFGDPNSPTKPHVMKALNEFAVSTCSTRGVLGTTKLHDKLEKLVAHFLNRESAMVFGMGFGVNSTVLAALMGKGDLIISDAQNHASIVFGARSSGARIKVFKHNDTVSLEDVIRESIVEGQPRTHRPWKRIVVVVEGIYSMEGELCPLKEIVAIKNKYKCYLYLDEAHSIGALGQSGRGVCQQLGVDHREVDVLMGTFTKSFGAVGGYVAGSSDLVTFLRQRCAGFAYSASISPPAAQQCISAMRIIMGADSDDLGQRKIASLRKNSNMFRKGLNEIGAVVMGDWDSPVIPLMLYNPSKIPAFSRECLKRGLAVVVVGFPASPLLLSRARFCISAAHTEKDIQHALTVIDEVCDLLSLKYNKRRLG